MLGALLVVVSAPAGAVTRAATPTALAIDVLSLPQRKPCDVSLFTSAYPSGERGPYPEGPPTVLASGPLLTEEQVRAQLSAFMSGSPRQAEALRVFDQAEVKAKIAESNLRAAYAALLGTIGESTMKPLLGARYATFRFGGISRPNAIAMSFSTGSGPQHIIFNRRYEREHFGLLIGWVAHEILHHDNQVNGAEEAINNAISALIHLQVLARHPELARTGTEGARQVHDVVLAFVNSREPGSPAGAIVAPKGKGIFPGSQNRARDFWSLITKQRKTVPGSHRDPKVAAGPDALGGVLRAILKPGVKIPKPLTFSQPTARLFGQLNDRWLSPVERVRASVLLGLVSVDEIVKATKLTRAQAVQTFRLGSITPACK